MRIGKVKLLVLAMAGAMLAAEAAVVRKLPALTVVENETISTDAMKATAVRTSNSAVCGAALRESGEAVVSGVRLGEAVLSYVDERGVFASRPVLVVPPYWEILTGMFSEDPEITIKIVGDKVVVNGATANVDTLRRAEQAKNLDTARIVAQVTYSTAQIGELVKDFLKRSNVTNVSVNVVGREVCLSGRMYDTQSIEQMKKRVTGFLQDFPGITVNTDELRIYKQKILISIEFVAYNDTLSRNLGFSGPESVTAGFDWNIGYNLTRNRDRTSDRSANGGYNFVPEQPAEKDPATGQTTKEKVDAHYEMIDGLTSTRGRNKSWNQDLSSSAGFSLSGVQATINLLKLNGAAKTLYSTTLSTQSGIEVEFQNGGTIHRSTTPGMGSSGDMVSIEYGYIIKATPLIVDANTVNLDFDLDNKQPISRNTADIEISRYQTKSKYLVRPGESFMLSGYKYNNMSQNKKGTPWLSNIPWIGQYLFGNTNDEVEMNEMLLVVTVNWALEDDSEGTSLRLQEMKDRKVEVEMP